MQHEDQNVQEPLISPEVARRAEEIPANEIEQRIYELVQSDFWPLIVRYSSDRINVMKDRLIIMDPQADLVKMCQSQGTVIGLLDLIQAGSMILTSRSGDNEKKKDKGE